MVDGEIEVIADGDGIAVIGDATAVDRLLAAEGLASRSLDLTRLRSALGTGSGVAQAASEVAASSGRWVKLSEASAKALKTSEVMKGSEKGLSRAVLTENGKVKGILEFTRPGSLLGNPAMLAGVAGIMAQLAMQQAMDEITDYLAVIDRKLDDVLRAQKDAVVADIIAVELIIDEALTVRDQVGRMPEVAWSKVQSAAFTIARTQAYALRQLDALAEKLESTSDIGDLAKATADAEAKVGDWLALLARSFRLHDALAVLELDRVLDAAPDELDRHRLGLRAARQNRVEAITQSTERLIARMDAAADAANAKVLLHPSAAPAVVRSSGIAAVEVADFQTRLGITSEREAPDARRWLEAATEVRDKVLETGAEGADAARRLGETALGRAKAVTGKVTEDVAARAGRLGRRGPGSSRGGVGA